MALLLHWGAHHAMLGQHQDLCRGAICLLQAPHPPQLELAAS